MSLSAISRRLGRGAVGGVVATLPMSAVMEASRRAGFFRRQPPEQITDRLVGAATAGSGPGRPQRRALSIAGHFGVGAGLGAAYAMLPRPRRWGARFMLGAAFGLGVYTISYTGLLPALALMPPPAQDRSGRQLTMLGAHLVFGATLALLLPAPEPGNRR